MTGGYKIIDLLGYNWSTSGDSHTVLGVYDAIESSNKALLLKNFSIAGIEHSDCYSITNVSESAYILFIGMSRNSVRFFVVESNNMISFFSIALSAQQSSLEGDEPSASM